MQYHNHEIKISLQEWKNRLYNSRYDQFHNQLYYLFNKIEKEKILNTLLSESTLRYPLKQDHQTVLNNIMYGNEYGFENEEEEASFCFQLIKHLLSLSENRSSSQILSYEFLQGDNMEERKENFIEGYISPIVNFLHDKLDKSNSTIFLLEKYKRRTEWFHKEKLFNEYASATSNYEKIFEDDLRLFLFDQGIDYPFSQPKSPSGRTDIVGSIDTSDPLIIEIKIYDSERNYTQNRIKEGFNQILKYTNDYNKQFGYLVIFNLDSDEIKFNFKDNDNFFPPKLMMENKCYFFVVVNVKPLEAASKIKQLNFVEITEEDLVGSFSKV